MSAAAVVVVTGGRLDRLQILVYLASIAIGLGLGSMAPGAGERLGTLVWPALGVLLYVTFTQVPIEGLADAFRSGRFLPAVLTGNFVVLPVVVWALLPIVGDDPVVRLGVVVVLLAPCTDWVLTFTHLSGGDVRRSLAAAPVLLLAQLALVPLYTLLILGDAAVDLVDPSVAATAFGTLIVVPLLAALGTRRWASADRRRRLFMRRVGRLPVAMISVVVFLVAASQVEAVVGSIDLLPRLVVAYAAFAVIAVPIGLLGGGLWGLTPRATRSQVFSLGTRNSFVVLPLVVSLSPGHELAAVVVVVQSLVELVAMAAYLWLVPRLTPV